MSEKSYIFIAKNNEIKIVEIFGSMPVFTRLEPRFQQVVGKEPTPSRGSITHVTNSSRTVTQQLSYDAWGQLRNPANQTNYTPDSEPALFLGRGYTGHEHLPMFGLVNMNARLYDPAVGRFLSPDPYVQSPDMIQNFNRYSYAMNNPLRYRDQTGEDYYSTNDQNEIRRIIEYLQANNDTDGSGLEGFNFGSGWNHMSDDEFLSGYGYPSGVTFNTDTGNGAYTSVSIGDDGGWIVTQTKFGGNDQAAWGYISSLNDKYFGSATKNITPWNVGYEWLTGTGPRERIFYEGDYFTELLKQHSHIIDTKNLLSSNFRNGNFDVKISGYELSRIKGVGKYIKDYSTLATGGLTGNLAVTYLGSYELYYKLLSTTNPAEVRFTVYNESTMASGIRFPVVGYWPVWKNYIGPFINGQFSVVPCQKQLKHLYGTKIFIGKSHGFKQLTVISRMYWT